MYPYTSASLPFSHHMYDRTRHAICVYELDDPPIALHRLFLRPLLPEDAVVDAMMVANLRQRVRKLIANKEVDTIVEYEYVV